MIRENWVPESMDAIYVFLGFYSRISRSLKEIKLNYKL